MNFIKKTPEKEKYTKHITKYEAIDENIVKVHIKFLNKDSPYLQCTHRTTRKHIRANEEIRQRIGLG